MEFPPFDVNKDRSAYFHSEKEVHLNDGLHIDLFRPLLLNNTIEPLNLNVLENDILVRRYIYKIQITTCMISSALSPTYIAEMNPTEYRGVLVSLNEAVVVLEILLGYSFGYTFSSNTYGWMYAYGCSVPVALVMLILSQYAIPPSSRWLMPAGRFGVGTIHIRARGSGCAKVGSHETSRYFVSCSPRAYLRRYCS